MLELNPSQYTPALALFENRRHMMKLTALAEGTVPGELWADDAANPRIALARVHNKLLLASSLPAEELAAACGGWLGEMAYGRAMEDADAALLFWDGPDGRAAWERALKGHHPVYAAQECYSAPTAAVRKVDPPTGYELVPVDAALLARGLPHTDALREEMCSERPSVEDFLRHSFGVAAVRDGALAGWCLSEYNCTQGCEIGIEVRKEHQRQGLAVAMVSAFADEAARRGIGQIGWLCQQSNAASSATARSAGLHKAREYGWLMCLPGMALELAVNGDACLGAGDAARAIQWFAQALALPDAPLWAGVELAIAHVALGQPDEAFAALGQALGQGFDNWGWLENDPRLEPLRLHPRWQRLPGKQTAADR